MAKRISALIIIIITLSVPLLVLYKSDFKIDNFFAEAEIATIGEKTEEFLKVNFPYSDTLRRFIVSLKFFSGEKQQNDIYLTNDYLLEIIKPSQNNYMEENTENIIKFAEKYRIPTYAMIVPTACAILQENIDTLAQTQLYNQKFLIESTYMELDGKVTTVDAYSALFANNDKYIYYKTHSALTSLGGYYLYETLTDRLNINSSSLDRFEIEYVDNNFYGDIYEKSPYKSITPDTISIYHFNKFRREYRVTSQLGEEQKTYYSLYPKESMTKNNPDNIILGGISDKIDINTASPNTIKLLVYGDESAMSYLPFLAVNYGEITFVNVKTANKLVFDSIDINSYDHVLFSFSLDNYNKGSYLDKAFEN